MYRSYLFLAKLKAISSVKLTDSLPRNDAVAVYYGDSMWLTVMTCSENYQHHTI
jgi:hypothetical protein